MTFKVKFTTAISILAILFISTTSANDATFKSSLENFSHSIFGKLWQSKGDKNIIYSPLSVQTSLAMVRMGASGQTATEMDRVLGMSGQTPANVAENYYSLLAKYENSSIVKIANKIYVADNAVLQDTYNQVLSQKFFSSAESIDFGQNEKSSKAINAWVESKTNGAIESLISPDLLSSNTRVLLLSAIYFKGEWKTPFQSKHTKEADFFYSEDKSTKVPIMFNRAVYTYDRFPQLDATAVRLFYKDSDISMIIFLPNTRTGLTHMLEQMKDIEFDTLAKKMTRTTMVSLHLPKFTATFEAELKTDLKNLGMQNLFVHADLGKMFKSDESLQISNVLHKAFIDVTETGTEAAAVTAVKAATRMMVSSLPFNCDHPFYYAIVNADNVKLFEGTVVKF